MPVYNGARYIKEAIEAVLEQDYPNLELLIADNASTDATLEIARAAEASDDRVRFLPSTVNRGAAWNFNRVVAAARGRYFSWAAHDDLRTPDSIGRCVEVLDEDLSVSLCFGRSVDIDEDGNEIRLYPPLSYAGGSSPAERGRDVLTTPSPCFEVFGVTRRSQLLSTGMIGAYTSSDRTLLFELALLGRFHEFPDTMFLHRQHPRRSVFSYSDPHERDSWFDPRRANMKTMPRWRLVSEHVRAVQRTPLTARERRRALVAVASWAGQRSDDLARDLVAWTRHHVRWR